LRDKNIISCKFALFHLYKLTHWLEGYCAINSIAVQKIVESFKKKMNCSRISSKCHHHDLIDMNESLHFHKLIDKENELKKKIIEFYAEHFMNKDREKAACDLANYLEKDEKKKRRIVSILWILIIFLCLIFISYFLLTYIPIDKMKTESIEVFFPAFNFTFMMILVFIGFGTNILIFRKYRLNYIFLLEINPVYKLRPFDIMKQSLTLLILWGILLLGYRISLTYFYSEFTGKFFVFSVTVVGLMIIFYFFPFHTQFYRFRVCLIKVLLRSFFPFGEDGVKFRDFIFGDIMCSILKPIATLTLTFCLFYCLPCREENNRLYCKRKNHATYVLQVIPYLIRMCQCINRFYYTKMAFPHLANTFKYLTGIIMILAEYLWWKGNLFNHN
jgi:hypothetical protein